MAHPMFVHVALLNRLRGEYLGPIIACDQPLMTQWPDGSHVFAWVRRAMPSDADARARESER